MVKIGKICMLEENADIARQFQHCCQNYELFITDNLFKFIRYAQVILPDLLMIDVGKNCELCRDVISLVTEDEILGEIPLLMLAVARRSQQENFIGIANYLTSEKPYAQTLEILETYCSGQKDYDVLLLGRYDDNTASALEVLHHQSLSCFEVHSLKGAQAFLRKNLSRCVCLYLPYDDCQKIAPHINHQKIFYVENPHHLKNLATLI